MITTAEAATVLGVSRTRVRALIAAGDLDAQRFGQAWCIEQESLERLASRDRPPGVRAMSGPVAWGAAALLDGIQPDWLTSSHRGRLKRLLREPATQGKWMARMAGRSTTVTPMWIHPSRLELLLKDRRTMKARWSVITQSSSPVVGGRTQIWVQNHDLEELRQAHSLMNSANPNVVLRVLPSGVPWLEWSGGLPGLVAATDLIDEPDPRSRSMGSTIMNDLLHAYNNS